MVLPVQPAARLITNVIFRPSNSKIHVITPRYNKPLLQRTYFVSSSTLRYMKDQLYVVHRSHLSVSTLLSTSTILLFRTRKHNGLWLLKVEWKVIVDLINLITSFQSLWMEHFVAKFKPLDLFFTACEIAPPALRVLFSRAYLKWSQRHTFRCYWSEDYGKSCGICVAADRLLSQFRILYIYIYNLL